MMATNSGNEVEETRVEIRLTPTQRKALQPLFDAVNKAARRSTGSNNIRGSILAQAFDRSVEFRFLDHDQAVVVSRALRRALKAKGQQ